MMAGSEAEERLRAKAEAALRRDWPDARIIHELVVDRGVVRLDLAAVTRDQIILAEIKSERDTLKRLDAQVAASLTITPHIRVVLAEKHWPVVQAMPGLWNVAVWVETDAGLSLKSPATWRSPIPDPRALFNLLWAQERRVALAALGAPVGQRDTCDVTLRWAVENLTGAQIRRAVCEQLRRRPFARADRSMEAA